MIKLILRNTFLVIAISVFLVFICVLNSHESNKDHLTNNDKHTQEREHLLTKATNGDTKAQYELANNYLNNASHIDLAKAEFWLIKAGENGYLKAQKKLITCYQFEIKPCKRNISKAIYWLEKQESSNDSTNRIDGKINLAEIYFSGDGVPVNYRKAAHWFRKAAELNSRYAQARLGLIYYTGGFGLDVSPSQAKFWLKKSLSDIPSFLFQFHRGIYSQAAIILFNLSNTNEEKIAWLHKAIEIDNNIPNTNPFVATQLGDVYFFGLGTQKNMKNAAYWYERAAKKGIANAQYSLGYLYFRGMGVIKDIAQSYAWVNVSIANGTNQKDAVFSRDFLYAHMTPAQTEEAEQLSKKFWNLYGKNTAPDINKFNADLIQYPTQEKKYRLIKGDTIYMIKEDDDLESIANRFDVTVESLRLANSLTETVVLHEGERLVIPTHVD